CGRSGENPRYTGDAGSGETRYGFSVNVRGLTRYRGMRGPGETRYQLECGVRGDQDIGTHAGHGETEIWAISTGSEETRYSERRVRETGYSERRGPGRSDIVNAGSGEIGYSECRVRGDRI
ncbi:unnamed protein product, partial [Staurois parvus]